MIKFVDEGKQDCPCGECQVERRQKRQQKRLAKPHGRTTTIPQHKPTKPSLTRQKKHSNRQRLEQDDEQQRDPHLTFLLTATELPGSVAFNPFPIERTGDVSNTMQYFFEVFAGSIHPVIDIPAAWDPKGFYDRKFSYCISDLGWFSATYAFAQAMRQVTITNGDTRRSNEVMKHSAQGITELRKKLSKGKEGVDDLAILTITSLMSIDLVFHQVANWKVHIDGLERILSMRGGIDSFNNSFLKYKVLGFQTHWLYQQMLLSGSPLDLTYPSHPFSPELCSNISKLPNDLAEIALSGLLNKTLIKLMADVVAISTRIQQTSIKAREDCRRLNLLAYELGELHQPETVSNLERLITMAATEFCLTVGEDRKNHWLLVGTLQMTTTWFGQQQLEYEDRFRNLWIWVGATLLATGEPQSQTVKLGRKMLARCQKKQSLHEARVLETCQRFVWNDSLTVKFKEKGEFGEEPKLLQSVSMTPSDSSWSTESGRGRSTPNSLYAMIT